jgi:hypothetical protein
MRGHIDAFMDRLAEVPVTSVTRSAAAATSAGSAVVETGLRRGHIRSAGFASDWMRFDLQ